MLLVAATPLRRTQAAEMLRISQGRLARACAMLQADPPRGLRLQEAGDRLQLVSGPGCADTVERYLGQPRPEPLSQAALDTLAIIAFDTPANAPTLRPLTRTPERRSIRPSTALPAFKNAARAGTQGRRGQPRIAAEA